MAIQDSDFLLVDDDGVAKKVRADKLKADRNNGTNLYSNKKLLVNTPGYESNFIYFSDLQSKIDNIGWMVIGSNGQTYKTSTTQIADYFGLDYTPPVDLTAEFVNISQRVIYTDSFGWPDYTGAYDVSEISNNFNGSARIYLAVKVTSGTSSNSQYNDVCIPGVQVVRDGSLVASWIFDTNQGGTGSGWQTTTSYLSGTIEYGIGGRTPADMASYPYTNISTTTDRYRFSWATGTGSSYTGCADGIGSEYRMPADGGSGTIAATGEGTVNQTLNTYYALRENDTRVYNAYRRTYLYYYASNYSSTVMRSPEFVFQSGDIIKVIHSVTGISNRPINPDDTLYIGIN